MAAIDNTTTPFVWPGSGTIAFADGSGTPNTITMTLEGSFSWTETGRTVTEVQQRRRHQSPPVVLETDDGSIEISISGKVTSFLGSSSAHPIEFLKKRGVAASYTSTAGGTAYCVKCTVTAPHPSGSSQSIVFNYCHAGSVECNLDGEDGQATFSATLTDFENAPTIS